MSYQWIVDYLSVQFIELVEGLNILLRQTCMGLLVMRTKFALSKRLRLVFHRY